MSFNFIVRNARPEEWEKLADIEAECFPPAEAATREAIESRMKAFPENFFVAEKDGEIIGFINGANTDERSLPDEMYSDTSLHKKEGKYSTVFGINTLPAYRKHGVGAKMMETFIAAARERGKLGVLLTCKDRLIHFYEKFGFVNQGVSASCHGGVKWNDMHLIF